MASAILASLIRPVMECIVPPIKRQLKYLCCFESNIQSLRDKRKELDDERAGLQMQVDTAKQDAQVILPGVETWLTRANEMLDDIKRIETDITKVKSGCMNIKSRFSLSRKATKTVEAIKELPKGSKIDPISRPPLPAAIVQGSVPLANSYEFESRKQIEEDIMEALRGKRIDIIGICGMGGVGKTTMAKRIRERVRNEHLFDEVVMVVVSQPVDMFKIQLEIAESLGVRFEEQTLPARAHKLHVRLTEGTKRTLIVMDDVWETIELEDLGIPNGSGCTVLLTSRDKDVFKAMKVQEICAVQILQEGESQSLFRAEVGTCVDDLKLVEDVIRECNGLPISLTIVARSLKDEEDRRIWEDALQQLRTSNPEDLPEVITKVYNPINLSYELLHNEHARSIFLLCCLFPEDYNIPMEELVSYSMGLSMFDGLKNLEKVRNRLCRLVKMLKSRFLLLDVKNEKFVKMHDVVRDVAIFNASKEGHIVRNISSTNWARDHSYCDCTWISFFLEERSNLPMELIFPKLRLLLTGASIKEELESNGKFFEGMNGLNVLSMRSVLLESLPQTIQLLKNLRTLILYECSLGSISVVCELSSLEILSCYSCDSITELSTEMGRLNCLRMLEFSCCGNLKRIVPGVISCLTRLEGLKIVYCFDQWEADGNASLRELESLSNLTSLEIDVEDSELAAQLDFCLSSKIVRYKITIGASDCYWEFDNVFAKTMYEKTMYLRLQRESSLRNWVLIFVKKAEALWLDGNYSNDLDLLQCQNIKWLCLWNNSTLKKVVNSSLIDWRFGVFPLVEFLVLKRVPIEEIIDRSIPEGSNSFKNLKTLWLEDLPELKHLWNQNQNVPLCNLSSIYISGCGKLCNLFSVTMAKNCLLQLRVLEISECGSMEAVLWSDENNGQTHITFPKLERLNLRGMKRLTTLCRGIESIEFPRLTNLAITECNELKSLVARNEACGSDDNDSLHLFCNPKVAWCHDHIPFGLEYLRIHECNSIRSLFSSSAAKNLVNLKELDISSCGEMVKVIEVEEQAWEACPFPNLECVSLWNLPKLASFCEWRCGIELPSLRDVAIRECPEMQSFTLGSLTAPNLKSVKISTCPEMQSFTLGSLTAPNLKSGKIRTCPEMQSFTLGSLTAPNLKSIHTDADYEKDEQDFNEIICALADELSIFDPHE